jgi:hypothetical protein
MMPAQDVKDPSLAQGSSSGKVAQASAENTATREADFMGGTTAGIPMGEMSGMYLNNCFEEGCVELDDGNFLDALLLRYNVYYQQLQFIREGDTLAFAAPSELREAYLGKRKLIYSDYIRDNTIDSSYFEVLSEGNCSLLRRHYIMYHVSDKISDCEKQYVYETCLYVKKAESPATRLKSCKKAVCCTFSDREEEIKQFIKTNRLKMRKTEDLILVIDFYNSLNQPR